MKVKVRNKVYDSANEPVMLILNDTDKENIARMPKTAHKYCASPTIWGEEKVVKFMETSSDRLVRARRFNRQYMAHEEGKPGRCGD